MSTDPAFVVSCDLPPGWAETAESGLFRRVFTHVRRRDERIVVSVRTSPVPGAADDDAWFDAAEAAHGLAPGSTPVDLGGATGLQVQVHDGAHRVQIARRGPGLDLLVEGWMPELDESRVRQLRGFAAAVLLPIDYGTLGADTAEALEEVDRVAGEGGDAFAASLDRAREAVSAQWRGSIAFGLDAADPEALVDLVELQLRYAGAAADPIELLRAEAVLARVLPAAPSADEEDVEARVRVRLGPYPSASLDVLARIFDRLGATLPPEVGQMPAYQLRRFLASFAREYLRNELREAGDGHDREAALAAARDIVASALSALVSGDPSAPSRIFDLLAVGESLVLLLDTAGAADSPADLLDAATVLEELATEAVQSAGREEHRRAARRLLVIAVVARASTLSVVADEPSLRVALEHAARGLEILTEASGDTLPDLLNIRSIQAYASLQLGEIEQAETFARLGFGVAKPGSWEARRFQHMTQTARAVASLPNEIRTLPDLELVRLRALDEDEPRLLLRVCQALDASVEENPLSLTTLERLVMAADAVGVNSVGDVLMEAAQAVLDVRRLRMHRSSELRVAADDALLARKLGARRIEQSLSEGAPAAAAVAVDRACARSLLLDLTGQPIVLARVSRAIADRYAANEMATVDRLLRARYPASLQVAPPWVRQGPWPWLQEQAAALRDWCVGLTGILGMESLDEAELQAFTERHGEPILTLYPVQGRVGGFLLEPGEPVRFASVVSTDAVADAAARLASRLGIWKSERARLLVGHSERDSIAPGSERADVGADSSALYEALLAPFLSMLDGARRLTVVPYRDLAAIPFAILAQERGRPVAETVAVTLVPSVSMLRAVCAREGDGGPRRAFVVGDPDIGLGPKYRLPGAAAEARSLADRLTKSGLWETDYAEDRDATIARYRTGAAGARLVHFACHGDVGGVARDAALMVAPDRRNGNRLTAAEIESVRLDAGLVFLSACRSGTGRPTADGTIGLGRAFLTAGARAVVGTYWNVPDNVTRELVGRFYDAWLGGVDVAEALRAAMIATRDGLAVSGRVNAAEWGAFFVLGDGQLTA